MKMYIKGAPCDASDGAVIHVCNAATQELLDTVPSATPEDVAAAVKTAREYKDIWAAVPQHDRSAMLIKAASLIEENAREIGMLLCNNMGKVFSEAYGEVFSAAQILRGYAERANHVCGNTMPNYAKGSENDIIFTRREPYGVVVGISPFNYPLELVAHKLGAALSTGNVVIYKPASDNPLAVIRFIEFCYKAGVPMKALQVITGRGGMIGNLLTESEGVDVVSMTGSTEVGVEIAKRGAPTLKHVFLELGGNDPFIVFGDADVDLAVKEAVGGRMANCGQTCCAPKRFFIHKSVKDQFVSGLIAGLNALKRGDPTDPETQVGCLINPNAADKVEKQVQHTVEQGAELILGGHRIGATYFEPTVLTGVTKEMDIAHDMEVFGPVYPIIEFETFQEAIALANDMPYGLQGCVFSGNMNTAIQAAAQLQCGGVVINGSSCYRDPDQPFGGYKMTGLGREGIAGAVEQFTQEKSYILRGIFS